MFVLFTGGTRFLAGGFRLILDTFLLRIAAESRGEPWRKYGDEKAVR